MAKKVIFITIHGMGEVDDNYYLDMKTGVKARLKTKWDNVEFRAIQYQRVLQPNEDQYLGAVQNLISGHWLRKLMINGFADAGSLEYSRSTPGGPYQQVQKIIFDELGSAYGAVGKSALPVVFLAHSLGCEVLSNYIWDGNKPDDGKKHGVWFDVPETSSAADLEFRKLKTLRTLVTTGCNIPVFTTGLAYGERYPIKRPNDKFVWENYYDKDDVLGYPLQQLSEGYKALVKDVPVSVGNLFTGWNPMSHTAYWENSHIQDIVANHLLDAMT
ncbi:hypothetical protein SAMN05421890_2649 [Ensifer adhaerens]|nr:hypothetical protein SAMN05421890_2649 [Ensifer adhaerens]